MRKALLVSCLLQAAVVSIANAAGPFGNISVGTWKGGAFSDDNTGAFSHCAASSAFGSEVILVVGQNANNGWLLGFASPNFHLNKGATVPIDVVFDGQEQARLFATATSASLATAILPPQVARTFQKSSLMVAVSGRTTLQFNLISTGPLIAMLANCVSKVREKGLDATAATDDETEFSTMTARRLRRLRLILVAQAHPVHRIGQALLVTAERRQVEIVVGGVHHVEAAGDRWNRCGRCRRPRRDRTR